MTAPFYTSPKVKAFADILSTAPMNTLVRNLQAEAFILPVDGCDLPATLSDTKGSANCYICDPTAAYIDYGIEETRLLTQSRLIQYGGTCLIRMLSPIVKASGLAHQVQLNNWLFSTNPVPAISVKTAINLAGLAESCPGRAIVLRSLNTISDLSSLSALTQAGFVLLPARQIYIDSGTQMTRDMKADCKLLTRTQYILAQEDSFTPSDYETCERLYRQLYLEKYPSLNPQYTAQFIGSLHRAGIIHLSGLRNEQGDLVAFGGTFCGGSILTQPLLGYDTGRNQSEGLYRMITSLAQMKARSEGKQFNMSAGVGHFKRMRGAQPAIEYTAVFPHHLPKRQQRSIRIMQSVLSRIGIPLLEKYGL